MGPGQYSQYPGRAHEATGAQHFCPWENREKQYPVVIQDSVCQASYIYHTISFISQKINQVTNLVTHFVLDVGQCYSLCVDEEMQNWINE